MTVYQASVVICAHNPRIENIGRVLDALRKQTLPLDQWELILIDNASKEHLSSKINLSWHPQARHVREEKLGLTNARLRAFKEARADILVFVDDDNLLDKKYIEYSFDILSRNPKLAAIGGKSIPEFVEEPKPWFFATGIHLGLRDLGSEEKIDSWSEEQIDQKASRHYPPFSPIGAGLVIRKQAANVYVEKVTQDEKRLSLGRTGKQLTSGEDNDIVLTFLESGWEIGYFPQLSLTHIIPPSRLSCQYLCRLNYASTRSWVSVLDAHGVRPWKKIHPYTLPLRQLKAFFFLKAWKDSSSFISWRGACGKLYGQSEIKNN